MKYEIDPHLRHDFSPPQPRRPARWTRLRLWFLRQQYRLGRWLLDLPPLRPDREGVTLQLLIAGLTLIVLFQMGLLVLLRPR